MKHKIEKAKEKKWILKSADTSEALEAAKKISNRLGINPVIARLLYTRGYQDAAAAKKFICMEHEMLSDPFLMKDMEKGIERLHKAIVCGEKITVYGDYDVDGVTAVCTLYIYLREKGANVEYYIPNRSCEGYGVSSQAIDTIADGGTKLIITVDTGITATDEVIYAKNRGIDFIITDHHECRSLLPQAEAVINPHRPDCPYPFKELAGVGVVFKFILAYAQRYEELSPINTDKRLFDKFADLVAIGTIADVMPIKDENRLIVSYGLKMLEETERPGIIALMKASITKPDNQRQDRRKKRSKITSSFIGYTLAPRINAAGRIKSAEMAVELFLSDDMQEASYIAEKLCDANRERQLEENKIIEEAYKKISKIDVEKHPVIVLDADDWHHGVIGIVSSRITEKYSRPASLSSFKQTEAENDSDCEIGKGSGRSVKGLNLVDALVYCSEHLVKYGGHELAAGLSVERQNLKNFNDISLTFAEELQILEPYGVGNPTPTFVLRDVYVSEISPISNGKHTKFVFTDGNSYVSAMYFTTSPQETGVYAGDKVDVLFNVDINEWMGRRSVQLIVKDVKLSANNKDYYDSLRKRYLEIHTGESFSEEENVLPTREDFAKLYRFILASLRQGNDTYSHRELVSELSKIRDGREIGFIKLKFMIKVFIELNIINIDEEEEEQYKFKISYSTSKTDLEKSHLLRKLRQQKRKTNT